MNNRLNQVTSAHAPRKIIEDNIIQALFAYEEELAKNWHFVNHAEDEARREGKPFVNPVFYVPSFKVGMEYLRRANAARFIGSVNPQAPAFAEGSPETALNNLIMGYNSKLYCLRKIQSTGLEKGAEHLVKVNGGLVNAFDETLKRTVGQAQETLVACAKEFSPRKRIYLGVGYVDLLQTDVLPLVEAASKPVIDAGECILGKIKRMGGPTFEMIFPENN